MRLVLLIAAALLWAGAASAQIKGGGYEIDPEPKRPDLEPRSHFQGFYAGGTIGVSPSPGNHGGNFVYNRLRQGLRGLRR